MRAAIYARVSTSDQNCELQLAELREYIVRRGWSNAGEYADKGWSGAKANRPEFDRLMREAGQRRFDVILCWKLDRFGRSLLNCKAALQELQTHGVRFIAASQNLDTDESNPASRFLLHILMAAAEFERELIRERSMAGLKRYRDQHEAGQARSRSGKNLAIGRPKRIFDRQRVAELRGQGLGWRLIGKQLGIGATTARRAYGSSAWGAPPFQTPALWVFG
jgi:putative DNA-invertase from lambdoid prophage Rac